MFDINLISSSILNPIPYPTALEILTKHFDCQHSESDKVAIFVAGPNGSGKSTLIANLYDMGLLNLPYINADIMALKNPSQNIYQSMSDTISLVQNYIASGRGFVYETVFSDLNKLELAESAKRCGFQLVSILLTTDNVEINIARVAKRVEQGGHDVPVEKIIMRYDKSLKNIQKLMEISNQYIHINNSLTKKLS